MSEPNQALRQLDFLVGEWLLEGRDARSGDLITGRLRFDWMDGGFCALRSSWEWPGGGYTATMRRGGSG